MFKCVNSVWMVGVMAVAMSLSTRAYSVDKKESGDEEKPNPYMQLDESWISISGTAVDTQPDGFTLDYGEGLVVVEMDDWDWYDESNAILEGDRVTVYGLIDDDLFETTTIEASSVYVEQMGTYFYASSADEEGIDNTHNYWVSASPIVTGQTLIRGKVTRVDGREFTVDTGTRKLTVDTALMEYNPMDDKGFQKISTNDYVRVSGRMNLGFWDKRKLVADTIVTLKNE